MSVAYVDASAFVKLFKIEPETPALEQALDEYGETVSSEMLVVEGISTAKRRGDPGMLIRANEALRLIGLIPFHRGIRIEAAAGDFNPPLRALDSIHLASALSIRNRLDVVFAYDSELCAAAVASGLSVASPA